MEDSPRLRAAPPVAVRRMLPSFDARLFPADGIWEDILLSILKNIQCMYIVFTKIK